MWILYIFRFTILCYVLKIECEGNSFAKTKSVKKCLNAWHETIIENVFVQDETNKKNYIVVK